MMIAITIMIVTSMAISHMQTFFAGVCWPVDETVVVEDEEEVLESTPEPEREKSKVVAIETC